MRIFLEHREKWIFAFVVLIAIYFGYSKKSPTVAAQASSQEVVASADFDKKVENFIINNPDVIIKSLEQMHRKKASEEQHRVSDFIKSHKEVLESVATSPFMGNKDSQNVVVAFVDYNCDYCKKLNIILNALVEKNKDVRVVLKQLPIINEASFYMSKAALAVYNFHPEKFTQFHNILFSHEYDMTKEKMQEIVANLGLDYSKLEEEMDSDKVKEEIKGVHSFANEVKINGVPALILQNEVYSGVMQLDKIEELIASQSKASNEPEAKK